MNATRADISLLQRSDSAMDEIGAAMNALFNAVRSCISSEPPRGELPSSPLPAVRSSKALHAVRSEITSLQGRLSSVAQVYSEMKQKQDMEEQRLQLQAKILGLNGAVREFAKRMRDAERILESALEDFSEYEKLRKDGRKLKKVKMKEKRGGSSGRDGEDAEEDEGVAVRVDVRDLISYAHRISYTTFAPPEFAQGKGLAAALPPAPQDEQLRSSQLYHCADEFALGIIRPKLKKGKEKFSEETAAGSSSQGAAVSGAGVIFPPGMPLPPPGWKAGDPLTLPKNIDLPPMPPGWKPGDPLPLPSLGKDFLLPPPPPGWNPRDPIPANAKLPEHMAMPAGWRPGDPVPHPGLPLPGQAAPAEGVKKEAAPGQAPFAAPVPSVPPPLPPGNIQVARVQLDLNPDMDDDFESDYSDESSDDE